MPCRLSQNCPCSEPPRSCREVSKHGKRVLDPLRRSHFLGIGIVRIRPVDEQRCSDQTFAWGKSPESAVITVVSIVTHHKEAIEWNVYRTKVVAPVEHTCVCVHYVRFT